MNLAAKSAKLALLGAFILQPAQWDAQAEAWSRLLPHDWPGEHRGQLAALVTSGEAVLMDLRRDGERIAFVVYRVDRHFPEPECVIVAAYSAAGKIDATELCLDELQDLAARIGCATLRFNTMRPGLIAKAQRAGGRVSEVIVRFDVTRRTSAHPGKSHHA